MMEEAWFEMSNIRRLKIGSKSWIPLRSITAICDEGKRGHLGFKEEFFGAGSLAIPVDQKLKAEKLGWADIGIAVDHRACVVDERYIPSDVYEYYGSEQLGFPLVLEQCLNNNEHPVWHLHQDFVIALELLRDGDLWTCPSEGDVMVARLHRKTDGRLCLLEVKAEFLFDYLCARGIGLLITAYWNREEVVEDRTHVTWAESCKRDGSDHERLECRVSEIHEGGMPFAAKRAVVHVSRTDVDPDEDVPVLDVPTDAATEVRSGTFGVEGDKLFVVRGEYWRNEWIDPGKYSPRIRMDVVPGSVFFITETSGTRESKDTLITAIRWLWFRPEAICALTAFRGGHLEWYTLETGAVGCSPDYAVHFGINSIGLVNVFAKDIGMLPDWQQRIWAGHNVSPDGGVSEELLASQMQAHPASTVSPESELLLSLARMNQVFRDSRNCPLFREHPNRDEILSRIHRFRATNEEGLFSLAKDIARVTTDSLDIGALHEIAAPPKGEKWGSLKSLEKALATVSDSAAARLALGPLVGTYELRLADAHLPRSSMGESMELAGIAGIVLALEQGQALIANCASAASKIASLLELLPKRDSSDVEN